MSIFMSFVKIISPMVYVLNSTPVQVDPSGFHYTQLKKGDRLSLECSSYFSTAMILPGNQHIKLLHYEKSDVDVEDTGTYACKCSRLFLCAEPKVYVYVHDKDGSGFLPLTSPDKPIRMPFVGEANIEIPCRPTTHSTKQDMRLLMDGNLLSEYETEFDPRKGFRAPVYGIGLFSYTCQHKNGASQTILVEIFDPYPGQDMFLRAKRSFDGLEQESTNVMDKTPMKLPSAHSKFGEKPKTIEINGELYQSVQYDSKELRRIYEDAKLLLIACIALVLIAVTICTMYCIRKCLSQKKEYQKVVELKLMGKGDKLLGEYV